MNETLAVELSVGLPPEGMVMLSDVFDGEEVTLGLAKA